VVVVNDGSKDATPKVCGNFASRMATELSGEARVRRSPMEREAMRFFNIAGNRFFADVFSFVLGQRFEDRLCGTETLS